MPKTRQQRIAEERAGYAPSPPQVLTDKPRVPRRPRAKMPSVHNTVAEGPVVSSRPLAAPVQEETRALVHVWVDENRYVYDPNHEYTISSALVPELVLFLNKLRDHGTQQPIANSTSSATQVSPSLNGHELALSFPISRTEPQLPEPSAPLEPSTGVVPPLQETPPPMKTRASFAPAERTLQQIFEATAPLSTPAQVSSSPQETYCSMTPHGSRPEAPLNHTAYSVKPIRIDQPVNKIPKDVTPTHAPQQAVNTSGHCEIVDKQTLKQKMPDQKMREVAKLDQTRPMRISGASLKRKPEASEAGDRKKRAKSDRESTPPPIKRKLSPVPSDPDMLRALGRPAIFRDNPFLPAYTLDGEARYGVVEPSAQYLWFHDAASAKKDTNIADGSTPKTPQASSSSTHARSVKNQFGFSPLARISERSETAPSMRLAENKPPMRVPSRLFDRMNANKRKRWTSPESIRNPKGKSYGLGEVEFYGNAEEDEDEVAGQQPGKVRRTSHLQNIRSQGIANSVSSRPCTGKQSIIPKTPIPITNKAGSFKVPSPGDSDWSASQSEDEGSSQAVTAQPSTIANPGPTSRPRFRTNAYKDWLQRAPPAATTAVQRLEVDPTAAGQTFEAALDSSPPPTSRPRFTAFEDWLQTASLSVASALERMDVDSNVAGAAFQRGLVNQNTT